MGEGREGERGPPRDPPTISRSGRLASRPSVRRPQGERHEFPLSNIESLSGIFRVSSWTSAPWLTQSSVRKVPTHDRGRFMYVDTDLSTVGCFVHEYGAAVRDEAAQSLYSRACLEGILIATSYSNAK